MARPKGSKNKPRTATQTQLSLTPVSEFKFVSLAIEQWESSNDGKVHNTIIALGSNGKVYRYQHSKKAWVAMPTRRIIDPEDVSYVEEVDF